MALIFPAGSSPAFISLLITGVPLFLLSSLLLRRLVARPVRGLLLAVLAAGLPATPPAQAQAPATEARALPPDRGTLLPPRRADADRLRELAGQHDFRYEEPAPSNAVVESLLARFWRWLDELLSTRPGHITRQYLIYALILVVLVFAVLKLLQVDITGVFGRSARRAPLGYDTGTENIHELDFPARLAEAEAAGNWRLALRLGYLALLKALTDTGRIAWQPDKTNHAYLAEVPAGPLREAFRQATREFDYAWYGELRLTPALYQQARAQQRTVSGLLAGAPREAAATSSLAQPA